MMASEEFGSAVGEVIGVADTVARRLTQQQRKSASQHFITSYRFEYLFWEISCHRQEWSPDSK